MMSDKSPLDQHRERAQRILDAPHADWHDRQARLHSLVVQHGVEKTSAATGFTEGSIRNYLSYKPYDLPVNSDAINESRLIKGEKLLGQ
jgi:hypothetical protein